MKKRLVEDFYAASPWLDWGTALVLAVSLTATLPDAAVGAAAKNGFEASAAVAGLAGLLLTAATFACTMAYSARSTTMIFLRALRPREQARNWMSVIAALLFAAVVAIVAIPLWGSSNRVALGLTAGGLLLGVAVAGRVLWWLAYMMSSEAADAEVRASGRTKLPTGQGTGQRPQ
ncbi:hypothetical protein BRM3_09115 [Brachybacterium huguangmaarense]|uniref:Uncharacterized protein n=1 Tax=Brachybacterium huguangmaarense TaxID=1652028 RepID=A0ABY6FY12_9MICO|nr:hypothetical protein [Brachybacterium huguangmaarense]UYG15805.1 hypothetical protein BRM3_09115 [Brachybacterium huguangmaarense]